MKKIFILLALMALAACSEDFAWALGDHSVYAPAVAYSATGTSGKALNANFNRKYLLVVNEGSQTVYVKVDAAHSGTEGVPIVAGGAWEPIVAPVNSLYIKSASGTQTISIVEGN